ncbi:hypothetical protein NUW54_g9632 [Trametes sanguinea]|uniref:Uncharacterized protein n=1 Tax=Trametes sanguinea TaxID=158606 RepID=A0ACC1P714_9APHY|nr:hypothetical protein NUW54_g9632 [Trametes sanguinea]
MNPYRCGLFDRDVKEPLPVLRMVFALASPEAAVASPAIPVRQSPRRDGTAAFTAYDIWCAGASSKTFDVIQQAEDDTFANLLKAIRSSSDYALQSNLNDRQTLRRSRPRRRWRRVGRPRSRTQRRWAQGVRDTSSRTQCPAPASSTASQCRQSMLSQGIPSFTRAVQCSMIERGRGRKRATHLVITQKLITSLCMKLL